MNAPPPIPRGDKHRPGYRREWLLQSGRAVVEETVMGSAEMDWRARGKCVGEYPYLFFPEENWLQREVARLCQGCPVIASCLSWALEHEQYGVWGGMTEREREKMRRARKIRLRPVGAPRLRGVAEVEASA